MKWLVLLPAVALAVAVPWLVDDYTTATLSRLLVLGLVGVSVALLTGVTGLPTLGQTAPFAAGAYAAAQVGLHEVGGPPVQLLAAAGVGAAFALLTAALVVYARGVVVLMITLAIGELAITVASRWKAATGGTDGLIATAAFDSDRARYLYALAVVGVVVTLVLLALRSPAGLLLRASRDDEARMRASGHPVTAYLAGAYVAAGAIAGAGGALLVTTQQYVSPADFSFDTAALLLLGVVIGGAGSMLGAVAGTALVFAARDWLSGLLPGHAPLLLGALFVLTAYLLPRGVAGFDWRRIGRRDRAASPRAVRRANQEA
ncbi:branched-chain amino acid ABC transporter permease [Phytohabitans sp. ZYX-F-186]|uniref:Branched-chain amino acid ABC transporter permease n=1 Tax=Phytohabitans maris TaxID=3071409 RepID=A0ABU0ZML0_9ACTN|nr:branched-chain amino acid ABC transporter permease [Phytohabitans sp. ZYX-F-186]MDQ7907881.1 branched-chain amino acid ABC transporter permease [Phytohabitans sp. ZYX-F-186]